MYLNSHQALSQVGGRGNLTVRFVGPPGADAGAACLNSMQWPHLDGLLLLGAGPVNLTSLIIQVRCYILTRCPQRLFKNTFCTYFSLLPPTLLLVVATQSKCSV